MPVSVEISPQRVTLVFEDADDVRPVAKGIAAAIRAGHIEDLIESGEVGVVINFGTVSKADIESGRPLDENALAGFRYIGLDWEGSFAERLSD